MIFYCGLLKQTNVSYVLTNVFENIYGELIMIMLRRCSEYRTSIFHASGIFVWFLIAVLAVVFFAGCSKGTSGSKLSRKKLLGGKKVSKQELRNELRNAVEFATSTINHAADTIDQASGGGIKIRKTNLVQRSRMKEAMHTMIEEDEPIVAYIEIWALIVRYTNYLTNGEGSKLYGEHQAIAVAAAKKIEKRMEGVGIKYLDEKVYQSTKENVKSFANQNPMTGVFSNTVAFATEDVPGKPSAFSQVMSIPMSPFTALKGVDRTASAINGVHESMDTMSDVVEGLPESARWQMLLLLLEAQEVEFVQKLSEDFSQMAENTSKYAELIEKFPKSMSKEMSVFIKDIDASQENLQGTVEKVTAASESIEKSLMQAQETTKTIDKTILNINDMAKQWEDGVNATTEAIEAIKSLKGEPAPEGAPPKDTLGDIKTIAKDVTIAANDFKIITAQLNELAESQSLAARVDDIDDLAGKIITRIIIMAAVLFAMAFVYKLAVSRLAVKK